MNATPPDSSNATPDKGPYLSVVLPCYNESEVLRETHRRVAAVCGDLKQAYEIVVVNDGSKAGSALVRMVLGKADRYVGDKQCMLHDCYLIPDWQWRIGSAIAAGRTVQHLLPGAVLAYIEMHHLYRKETHEP